MANVTHARRHGTVRSASFSTFLCLASALPLAALSACSGGSEGGGDVPTFQPSGSDPTPPANTPSATAPVGDPTTSGSESLPPTAGLDPNGVAPGNLGGNEAGPADPNGPGAAPAAPTAPLPAGGASTGCGLSQGTPTSPQGIPQVANIADTLIYFPPGYDGSTPLPLVFAFHGANRTNADMRSVDSRTAGGVLEMNYVVAYMKSVGGGWDIGADYPRFAAALDAISSQYCIDTAHVFAFGHSSGAQFIAQMLGDSRARETRLAGIVPVASSRFDNPSWSPVPTFVIHGLNDTSRQQDPDGADDIIQYTDSNQCSGGPEPLNVAQCNSIAGTGAVNPGCVQYSGCAAPVQFCNHDDPNYIDNGNPTNHGWPCFANDQIFQFFESLR
jgi:poly(3-hydroxybutyrate) depolymerase